MSEEEQLRQRLRKLDAWREHGIPPFGVRFRPTHHSRELAERFGGAGAEQLERDRPAAAVAGRIVGLRRFGKAAFAHLQDETGRIQVHLRRDLLGESAFELAGLLDLGDLIGAEGTLFRTKTGELTLAVERFSLLAKALRPLPEKWHGLTDTEARFRQRYLDLIANPEVHEVFIRRSRIIQCIRNFLHARGFLEVETPMMQPIPGGAAARPFVTHHNALGMDLYLRVAPELYLKRLIVGGYERVFEINRNFRNEGISTVHNPEFTMLEFYLAHADYTDLFPLTEELIAHAAREVLGRLKITYRDREIDLQPPWPRRSYMDALAEAYRVDPKELRDPLRAKKLARQEGVPVPEGAAPGRVLEALFEARVESSLIGPTFITDYPTDLSPLAKRRADDPELAERFELYIFGMEVANAFSELNDPQEQRRRFEAQLRQRAAGDAEAHRMDEDFVRALEYGMPPTAGEGIGIDRLVMLLTDRPSIREVILFPLLRPERPE